VVVLEVITEARGVFTPLHPSLQLLSCAHPIVSHYREMKRENFSPHMMVKCSTDLLFDCYLDTEAVK
jgi:hypothetical protein